MTTPRQRRHETTKREILDAAWTQAESVGVAGISLRETAKAVGLSAPSLYTYFESKDAIYDAMFIEAYEALRDFNREVVEATEGLDRVDALTEALERFVGFCQRSPARYTLMFTRPVPGWEPSPEAYAVSIRSYEEMASALSRFGIEGPEALDLYTAIAAGIAAQQMANDPAGDRWARLAHDAMEMLVHHVDQAERGAP